MSKRKQRITTAATKLSERSMLATLHTSMWSGMQVDLAVTEEVSENHKANKDSGRYNKKLIAPRFLNQVAGKINVARRSHRLLTLPWEDDGTRILSTTGYLHYAQTMDLQKQAVHAATITFLKHMPEFIDEAKVRLGTMFNADDYPPLEEVKRKFHFDVEFKPVPDSGDFRAKLSNEAVKAITQDIEDRCNTRVEEAIRDIYRRVGTVTKKMVESLREFQPATKETPVKAFFRDTLVHNVNEIADLIPSLNITGDPKLDELAQQLKTDLGDCAPEVLRHDSKARKQTIDAAERILKKVRMFI